MTSPRAGQPGSAGAVLPIVAAAAAGVGLLVVLFVAIGALGGSGSGAATDAGRDVRAQQVSAEAYERIELQTPKEDVLAALRPAQPVDLRVLDRYQERSPETVASSCVYFDSRGVRAGALYRFCFEDDVLVDKTVVLPTDEP